MLNETSMLYKLTVMYILHRVDMPISNSQISNFILLNDYTDYFNIQQIIGELIDDGYISREVIRNKTLYTLTDSGEAALKLLSRELSQTIRDDVDTYIKNNRMELKDDISVLGKYYQADLGRYIAHLYIDENGEHLIELNIAASSEEEADRLCSGWTKSSSTLYPLIIKTLLSKQN